MKNQEKIAVAFVLLIIGTFAIAKVISNTSGEKQNRDNSAKRNTRCIANCTIGQPNRYYDICEKLAKLSIHKSIATVLGSGR